MIHRNRLASIALTLSVCVAAAVMIYAVAFRSGTPSQASQPVSQAIAPPPIPSPTATFPDDAAGSRSSIDKTLAASAPGLVAVIKDVESGNVADLLANHLKWLVAPCQPGDPPDNVPHDVNSAVSFCSVLGVPQGTTVDMFPQDEGIAWRPEQDVRAGFDAYLGGTHPTLGLVARKSDGSYYLSFSMDNRHAPWEKLSDDHLVFRTDPSNSGVLADYDALGPAASPFENIQEDEEWGTKPNLYDVMYVSNQLRASGQARQAQLDAHAHDTPSEPPPPWLVTPGATPPW